MPKYRRVFVPGGTYFFTVVTAGRQPILTTRPGRKALLYALNKTRRLRPFEIPAFCVLPDHLHCIWQLPEGDADFPGRWSAIKALFTRRYRDLTECGGMRCRPAAADGCGGMRCRPAAADGYGGIRCRPTGDRIQRTHPAQSASRKRRGLKPVWQKRFWEHMIRDEDDFRRHVDYVHYNPVKHGLAGRAGGWRWSTFARFVREGIYPADWGVGGIEEMAEVATARE